MAYRFHEFETREALVENLAGKICDLASESEHLFVSGGSTPKKLFQALSRQADAFAHVEVNLVDERWVPVAHEDSNAALVAEHLKVGRAFQPLYLGQSPEQDCNKGNERLAAYDDFGTLVLGMGGDAHTASLFPDLAATEAAFQDDAPLLVVTEPETAPHKRIGLSLNGIRKAKNLILHIEGLEKRQVFEESLKTDLPIARVANHSDLTLDVYWAA